ncbi:MAG: DMT family transporter [Planktotalea sp.]|uniref:DMT family transporter n=1 Tax=Planktotalea sp. TaxID=2029877 RepID=UPI0026277360|nr:DMT family transporter [Planktotalea sp.]MDG1082992.1 DMT family transporter [Planktotalea sp.]
MTLFANLSDNAKGALFMMCSMAAFTFNDLFIKAIGTDVPLSQLLLLRGILATTLIYLLARYLKALAWPKRAKDRWLIVLRSAAEVAAAYFFLTALLHMPFANVTAILQTLPLTVTLAAALVFKEAVGWRRILAIMIGFCGMMLIVRPGTDGFTIHSIYVLIAVLCVTVRDLAARRLSKDVPSLTVTLVGSIFVTGFGGIGALATGEWSDMTSVQIAMLVASALFVIGGYVFSVMVMRVGEVGFTSPFRYTAMLWALLLGYVFFGEWPETLTFVGAGLIVATGIFTLYREARVKRRQASMARI